MMFQSATVSSFFDLGGIIFLLSIFCGMGSSVVSVEAKAENSKPLLVAQRTVQKERRIALVIGNGAYGSEGNLRNPTNDATDMAEALRRLKFDVILIKNADKKQMEESLEKFYHQLKLGHVGLLYYAGHGIQSDDGNNYLIPVGARINRSSDIPFEAIPLGKIVGAMEGLGDRINIVMIDACRDNPYSRGWRSRSMRGLAPFQLGNGEGTFISFATTSGDVADDGNGRNSPYTAGVLQHIQVPNVPIGTMFENVRKTVYESTNRKQRPREDNSLIGTFIFNPTSNLAQILPARGPISVVSPKPIIPKSPSPSVVSPKPVIPKSPSVVGISSSEVAALEIFREGQEKFKDNKYKEALLDYERAIYLKPDFPEAYYARGNIYYSYGISFKYGLKRKEAMQNSRSNYDKAIQIKPDFSEAYYGRGKTYYYLQEGSRLGSLEKINSVRDAISDYSKSIQINPNLSEAYYERGKLFIEASLVVGYVEEDTRKLIRNARSDYDKAIQIKPNFAEAYYEKGKMEERIFSLYFSLDYPGVMSEEDKKKFIRDAIASYDRAIQLKPDFTEAYEARTKLLIIRTERFGS
jgi:tetratricopeptide (TPR) repeat protein